MSRRPKIPPGSQSKYEKRLMNDPFEKREKPRNEISLDRGCGNPNCRMCYPNGAPNMSNREIEYRRMRDAMMNSRPSDFVNFGESITGRFSAETVSKPSRLTELRKPIEQYLLTVPATVTWDDVIGNAEAKQSLRTAIEASTKHKELYEFYKMTPARGVVLHGPPGCGKTMFAKATAGALAEMYGTSVELISINGMEIESPFIGVTEKLISDMFTYARAYHKEKGHQLVIFIDEADALLPSRNSAARWQVSTVASFLAELDGLDGCGAFVMLATNRPEALDEALLRDGRCSEKIKIVRPGYAEAKSIFRNAMLNCPTTHRLEDLIEPTLDYFVAPHHHVSDFFRIADDIPEEHHLTLAHIMNGAMLVGLVARAKVLAFNRDLSEGTRTGVTPEDLRSAIDKLVRENRDIQHTYALTEYIEAYSRNLKKKGMN